MSTLGQFQSHLEKFGPDCLLAVAARELSESELGELKALVQSFERTYRWHNGRWIERRQGPPRKCDDCGLDLPVGARSTARYHKHCRERRRSRARRARGVHRAVDAVQNADPMQSEAI